MIVRLHHHRLNGAAVLLIVSLDADGAIIFWRSEDPTTGAHVTLDTADKWWAISAIHRGVAKMARGAA